ncbi:hypothetical protein THAPSDRAFT_24399 [Thalassiosira pseudonana CCMP1335]|uniref:Dihydrolipoyl dehydrogenase n=1 Tax=Thalassiosira pseudonana TaxID=35128 RepID=B8LC90_THAPS|nr:hypothetical protein THAPSDRAFT_24399 [Thalassiosira pseudonana CCMP1335]EED87037.1 hypothetical protein THAPSDRAFT_24399 [Thalassiosira pseudonana CCMP1335]
MRLLLASTVLSAAIAFAPQQASRLRSTATSSLEASKCGTYDYDVIIIGCGVGGHGAALHSRSQSLTTAVFSGNDVGGTCVNRGCVPSKALLAASGRVREMQNEGHLSEFGITVEGGKESIKYDREGVAGHARQLAERVKGNLEGSLVALGVDIVEGRGVLTGVGHEVKDGTSGKVYTAKDIILAPGSIPFVPPGVTVDEKTVYTSDGALKLQSVPEWVAIIGSGYIGLEFSDVYTALGSEVTFIEALPNIMPTFDREIAKQAERLLIRDRAIDYRTGVEHVETLEVDAAMVATGRVPNTKDMGLEEAGIETQRGFIAVNEKMQVLTKHEDGEVVPNVWCIGDANGKMMLAHAASAQGISAIENICGRDHAVNHDAIPAACFTHPEIAMVGPTEEQAIERAEKEGWTLGKSQGSFRANSKALAELEGNGIAKVLYNKETGKVVAVHIIGIHAADLIQECANAVAAGTTVQELSMMVHTHPTLCEVLDEAFKGAVGMSAH